jgi:predicted transcriptional regulator
VATTTIGVKIDQTTKDRLRALAEAKDRTPHWIMKEALAQFLDREERREHGRREDQARWDRFVLTGESVPHERARQWLRSLAEGKEEPCPAELAP